MPPVALRRPSFLGRHPHYVATAEPAGYRRQRQSEREMRSTGQPADSTVERERAKRGSGSMLCACLHPWERVKPRERERRGLCIRRMRPDKSGSKKVLPLIFGKVYCVVKHDFQCLMGTVQQVLCRIFAFAIKILSFKGGFCRLITIYISYITKAFCIRNVDI